MDFVHYPNEKWFLPGVDDEIPNGILDNYTKSIYNPNGELKSKHLLDANAGVTSEVFVHFLSDVNLMVKLYISL